MVWDDSRTCSGTEKKFSDSVAYSNSPEASDGDSQVMERTAAGAFLWALWSLEAPRPYGITP